MRNFAQPYLATNITDFWRRWHISLSTWLRDYLYIPLGGNRKGRARTYVNLMLTMLLGGLWHGASWTFVVWGGLHGVCLAVHKAWLDRRAPTTRAGGLLGALVTFHLVCLAWIFFRAESFADARAFLTGIFAPARGAGPIPWEVPLYMAAALGLDFLLERRGRGRLSHLVSRHWALETAFVTLLLVVVVFVGENHVFPFIYFQF
jgi:D-alanyl-lipoteichoic acid acyltransferase DltB (MBOAT superfamily)